MCWIFKWSLFHRQTSIAVPTVVCRLRDSKWQCRCIELKFSLCPAIAQVAVDGETFPAKSHDVFYNLAGRVGAGWLAGGAGHVLLSPELSPELSPARARSTNRWCFTQTFNVTDIANLSPTQISVSSHRNLFGGEQSHTYFCERTLACQRKLGFGVEDPNLIVAKLLIRYLIPT
jgi:hypothetical protein